MEWTFSCSVSPSWRALFPAVASVPTYLRPQRAGVPLPREQRCARLRESPPRRLRSPCLVASAGLPHPSAPRGSWEARAGGNGTRWPTGPRGKRPRDCSVRFCFFPIFFFNSEKTCQLHLMFWKPFQRSRKHATRGGSAGPRHLLTVLLIRSPCLSKNPNKASFQMTTPALPLKHSARVCSALQQVELPHRFSSPPAHHHPRSLIR